MGAPIERGSSYITRDHLTSMEAMTLEVLAISADDVAALDDQVLGMQLLRGMLELPRLNLQCTYARVAREVAHLEYLTAKVSGEKQATLEKKMLYSAARVAELQLELEMEKIHHLDDVIQEHRGDLVDQVRAAHASLAPAIIAAAVKDIQCS